MPAKKTMRDLHPMMRRSEPQAEDELAAEPEEKVKRVARTFYLDPDLIPALDNWVKDNWVAGTKKPEVSAFVSQAIRKALNPNS